MADKIDKALTQEPRKELNIPGQEEIQEAVSEQVEIEQSKKVRLKYKKKMMDQLQLTSILTPLHQKVAMSITQT